MFFSGSGFSEEAFSDASESPIDSDAFEAFLAEISCDRCWLLEVDAFSLASSGALDASFSGAGFSGVGFSDGEDALVGGVKTLRFSSHGYTSKSSDSPASTWYEGRLSDAITVERKIIGKDEIRGLTSVYAECELNNADGEFDELLVNYALDGRRIRILWGRPDDALADFGLVFTGVFESATVELDVVRMRFSDGSAKLKRPVNETVYAGTGGLEGGADLKGKPKPRGWGHVLGISPPLVDTVNLIYQVNDGPINDVPEAFDRGIALAKVAGVPAPGQYQVDTALGTVRVGVKPAMFTCNAKLDATSSYVDKAGDIVLRLLALAGLYSTEIEPSSFAQLNVDAPAETGKSAGTDSITISDFINDLLAGVGAFGGFSRQGAFSVGLVAAASGAPRATFDETEIISISREPLPAALEPSVWRASVAFRRNYTVQTDLASAVPVAQTTFAQQAVRFASVSDAAVKSRNLLAREYVSDEGVYAAEADASAEAQRKLTLWSNGRAPYRLKLRPRALTRDMGQVVDVIHPRLGFQFGKSARVIGHAVRGNEVELMVLA